jgi:hypothetical protein
MIVESIKRQGQRLEEQTFEVAGKLGIEKKSLESGELIDSIKDDLDKAPTISDELRRKLLPGALLTMIYGCATLCKKADELSTTGEVVGEAWAALLDFICHGFYCLGLIQGIHDREAEASLREVFSNLGKAGAAVRHMPMKKLRDWTLDQYTSGSWSSANAAAHALKGATIAHGKTINAYLAEENAQRTIAEWIRDSKRSV